MKTNLKNQLLLRTSHLWKSLSYTAAASLLVLSSAHAVNIWDGGVGGGDGNWNTPANWDDDAIPTAGVLLTFAGAVQPSTTNDVVAVIPTFLGINFTNDGSSGKTAGFTLAGAGINPGNANIVTTAIVEGSTPITDTISACP